MSRGIDFLITYRVVKMLITPFEKTEAFKRGIIDKDGKVLKKYRTLYRAGDKKNYTLLHRFVFNLKRILKRVGLGSKLGSFAVALALLIKEDKSFAMYKDAIESGVIMYLKEQGEYDKLLKEEGEIPELNIEQEPFMTCFGIDVYERGDELVSETEYAQTL
tara:strand:+ start:308 stop:790 length:483 start_codon:yes stop_codon:yes gene_type:complete